MMHFLQDFESQVSLNCQTAFKSNINGFLVLLTPTVVEFLGPKYVGFSGVFESKGAIVVDVQGQLSSIFKDLWEPTIVAS